MAAFVLVTTPPVLRSSWPSSAVATTTRGGRSPRAVRMSDAPPPAAKSSSSMSRAMPFMPNPQGVDASLPGFAGFDPFGFTDRIDRRWMVEAEVKNGRVAMLAALGMVIQEFIHLPNHLYSNPLPAGAFNDVPSLALWQIFAFCGLFELATYGGNINYPMMLEWFDKHPERVGGAMGFDVLKFAGPMDGEKAKRLRTSEIKNGRLAMLGAGGMITQSVMYNTPIVDQLLHFQPMNVPM
ncbi:hypothetical protein MMPV_005616 [Pyropia vietnamensis]